MAWGNGIQQQGRSDESWQHNPNRMAAAVHNGGREAWRLRGGGQWPAANLGVRALFGGFSPFFL